MRLLTVCIALIMTLTLAFSCAKKKEMTMEDFVKIDLQVTPTMEKEDIEKIAEKHGYTYNQYKEFSEMVEKDPKLQEQRGDVRLKDQKESM